MRNNSANFKQTLQIAEKRSDLILITTDTSWEENNEIKTIISEHLNIVHLLDNEREKDSVSYYQKSKLKLLKNNHLDNIFFGKNLSPEKRKSY